MFPRISPLNNTRVILFEETIHFVSREYHELCLFFLVLSSSFSHSSLTLVVFLSFLSILPFEKFHSQTKKAHCLGDNKHPRLRVLSCKNFDRYCGAFSWKFGEQGGRVCDDAKPPGWRGNLGVFAAKVYLAQTSTRDLRRARWRETISQTIPLEVPTIHCLLLFHFIRELLPLWLLLNLPVFFHS